jgi:GNAT superfamily N-acetyltransferase
MTLGQSWKVRRYEPEDDSKIDALLKTSLPGYAGWLRWNWMHKGNPLGFHGLDGDIWVAESSDGGLIGYYDRIRYSMHCFGKIVLASQALNMATHPEFRRLGIATELMASSIRDAKRNGIKLTFGFPNRLSYPLAMKKGACDAGPAKELHLVLDSAAYVSSLSGGPIRRTLRRAKLALPGVGSRNHPLKWSDCQFETVSGFTDDADSVRRMVQEKFDLGLARTREYLMWRYDPRWGDYDVVSILNRGTCSGYVVTGTTKKGGKGVTRIHELVARNDDPRTYEALLAIALEKAQRGGSAYLAVSSISPEACLRSLRRLGFRSIGRAARYVLVPYDDQIRKKLGAARVYHSLGDRDYL